MIDCSKCCQLLLGFCEKTVNAQLALDISNHLEACNDCRQAYGRILEVYQILDQDAVDLPSDDWFESVKVLAKQPAPKKKSSRYFAWALIPAAAAAAIILLVFILRQPRTFEIEVPTSFLLEDNYIASLTFKGLIDDELIADLNGLEEWAVESNEQMIFDMSAEEQKIFTKKLTEIYLTGT